MWTLIFWKAVAERALKTAGQSAILAIGADSLHANALTFDWATMGGFALGGAVLSVLSSIASAATTDGSPSLNGAEIVTPKWAIVEPADPQPVTPTSVVQLESGVIETHYSDGTISTDPGIGNPPITSLS